MEPYRSSRLFSIISILALLDLSTTEKINFQCPSGLCFLLCFDYVGHFNSEVRDCCKWHSRIVFNSYIKGQTGILGILGLISVSPGDLHIIAHCNFYFVIVQILSQMIDMLRRWKCTTA